MEHLTVRANGAAFHVARTGQGKPLLLLHGWPEFWLTWEPVMTRLADRFTLYAPDLRGFGDSDKPEGPYGPDQHAADMLALMDALGLKQAGIVGHDVGGAADAAAGAKRAGPHRRIVLLRLRLSRHRTAHGGAGPAQQHLVSVVQPDGDGAGSGRRDARELPHLYRAFPEDTGRIARMRSTTCSKPSPIISSSPAISPAALRITAAAHAGRIRMMKGEAPELPPIDVPDLRALGRARSAVSLCLDRSDGRDVLQISISRCFPASGISRIARIPIARQPRSRRSSSASAGVDRF